jgi:hypothetical protein
MEAGPELIDRQELDRSAGLGGQRRRKHTDPTADLAACSMQTVQKQKYAGQSFPAK